MSTGSMHKVITNFYIHYSTFAKNKGFLMNIWINIHVYFYASAFLRHIHMHTQHVLLPCQGILTNRKLRLYS